MQARQEKLDRLDGVERLDLITRGLKGLGIREQKEQQKTKQQHDNKTKEQKGKRTKIQKEKTTPKDKSTKALKDKETKEEKI